MESSMFDEDGVRIAVEGCGHGTLDAIYASVAAASKARGWKDGVDLLIIGGDFQAVRNAADLNVMSVPAKYRELADFPAYYSGEKTAPYLTVFIAGNHEASSHLWELYYGGWVAPKIYYMGAANVLRFGPLRIAAMSGIWKGFDYQKPHHERLPFTQDDVKSFYHVREFDVRKLLLLREQVDVGLSHDWPRAIENHGNAAGLWRKKPDFKQESIDGTLGSQAAMYVMDRLRPAYWFSAHMHCKFAAVKTFKPEESISTETVAPESNAAPDVEMSTGNPDEIDLDEEEESDLPAKAVDDANNAIPAPTVSDELRAQLPASFTKPKAGSRVNPGQPVPPTITNTTTRFLALDKCLPGRKFIQLCPINPIDVQSSTRYPPSTSSPQRFTLQYDPEWLAITRVFDRYLSIGERQVPVPPNLGEATYLPLIDKERAWIDENIVQKGKLDVVQNFAITAPPHRYGVDPETVSEQPHEYTSPQIAAFCELLGVKNHWDASEEERAQRREAFVPQSNENRGGRGGGWRGGGRGGRGGFGGRGRGRPGPRGRGRPWR